MAKIGHSKYNRAKVNENTQRQLNSLHNQRVESERKITPVIKKKLQDHSEWNTKHGLGQKADTYNVTAKNHKTLGVHPSPEDLKKLNTTHYDKHKGEPTQWHTEKGKRVVTAQSAHRVYPRAKMTHPTIIKGSLEDNRSNEAYKVYRKSDKGTRKVKAGNRLVYADKSIEDLKNRHEKALDAHLKQKQADEVNKKAHDTSKRLSHDKRKATYVRRQQTKEWNNRQKAADDQAKLAKGGTISKELTKNENITHRLLTDKSLTEGQKRELKNQRVSREKLDTLAKQRGRKTNQTVYGQMFSHMPYKNTPTAEEAIKQHREEKIKREGGNTKESQDAYRAYLDKQDKINDITHKEHAARSLEKTKKNKGATRQDKNNYIFKKYNEKADNMENGKKKKDINGKVVKAKGVSIDEAYRRTVTANREKYFGTGKKVTVKKTPAAKTTRKQTKKEKKEYIKGEDW